MRCCSRDCTITRTLYTLSLGLLSECIFHPQIPSHSPNNTSESDQAVQRTAPAKGSVQRRHGLKKRLEVINLQQMAQYGSAILHTPSTVIIYHTILTLLLLLLLPGKNNRTKITPSVGKTSRFRSTAFTSFCSVSALQQFTRTIAIQRIGTSLLHAVGWSDPSVPPLIQQLQ